MPVDLADAAWVDALLQARFDPGQRVVWLLEGFLFYLPAEVVTALLERITALSVLGS